MKLRTNRLSYLQVILLFPGAGGSMLRHYASLAALQDDVVLGLFDGETAVGCMVLLGANAPEGCTELTSLYIKEEYQGRGCGGLLLQEAVRCARELGKRGLTLRVVESHPLCAALTKMAVRRGFAPVQTTTIARCRLDNATNEKWSRVCSAMTQKLCGRLTRQGFLCCSLAHAPPVVVGQLVHGGLFEQKYSPAPLINGMQGRLWPDFSYVAYQGDAPAAVTVLLKGSGNSAIFQLIAAATNYQKTGAVLLPVAASINQAFALGLDSISYCIYDDNEGMKSLAQEMLAGLPEYETKQHIFQCCFNKD